MGMPPVCIKGCDPVVDDALRCERPYSDPEAAARRRVEIASSVEALQVSRTVIKLINNWPSPRMYWRTRPRNRARDLSWRSSGVRSNYSPDEMRPLRQLARARLGIDRITTRLEVTAVRVLQVRKLSGRLPRQSKNGQKSPTLCHPPGNTPFSFVRERTTRITEPSFDPKQRRRTVYRPCPMRQPT
jgi:hypothetical protein